MEANGAVQVLLQYAADRFVGYRRKSVNRSGSEAAVPLANPSPSPGSLPPGRPANPPSRPSLSLFDAPPSAATSGYFIAPSRLAGPSTQLPFPTCRQTGGDSGIRLQVGRALVLASLQLLVDEEGDQADSDDEDDAEDDHDTGILAGPVAAPGELGEGVASDDGKADGGHVEILKSC